MKKKKTLPLQRTVKVKELPDGTQFIKIPNVMLNNLGWKQGDEVKIIKQKDGTYKIEK